LVDVYFNTNATLLDKIAVNKLIDAKLPRLSVSFEGYTKKVYEKYRVGSDFDKVVKNIEHLQMTKALKEIFYPYLRIQTVLLPELKRYVSGYVKFWQQIADEVGFLDYQPRVEKYKFKKSNWACQQLWQRMGVLVDGTIIPCNHDERKLNALGNIKDTTIYEAWHSNKMNLMRQQHKIGASHFCESCRICYLRHSEILKEEQNDSGS